MIAALQRRQPAWAVPIWELEFHLWDIASGRHMVLGEEFNHGLFFNTEQMDRFILPYLTQWAKEVKARGAYAILHSEGNLTPCLQAIADSGIDALQAIDPTAGMDIVKTKEQIGDRLCLCGNMDCGLVLTATEQQIYDATRRLITTCRGGLVLGCSNVLQSQTPIENYMAIIDAWKDHGQ